MFCAFPKSMTLWLEVIGNRFLAEYKESFLTMRNIDNYKLSSAVLSTETILGDPLRYSSELTCWCH